MTHFHCSLTIIWQVFLEVLYKNETKTGNHAIETPTEAEFIFLSQEQTYRCCLELALSCPLGTGFILDLKELTVKMRQQLKYSYTQDLDFSAQKCEIGHAHLSI